MVPEIPSESFRVLSQFSCLETWSNWSFPEEEGVAFLGGSYKTWGWPLGRPKFEQAGWGKKKQCQHW